MFKSAKSTKTEKAIADGSQSQPPAHSGDFLAQYGKVANVDLHSLRPGTELRVDTSNSQYRILLLDGNDCTARVQGGRYFLQRSEVRIEGSAVRGGVVKPGWICSGLSLELSVHGKQIVTSPVRSINVEPLQNWCAGVGYNTAPF
jgi:hypothetical protein